MIILEFFFGDKSRAEDDFKRQSTIIYYSNHAFYHAMQIKVMKQFLNAEKP